MSLIKPRRLACLVVLLTLFCLPSFAQTQLEMNDAAAAKYRKADKEMNIVYQKILKEYAAQPVFITKLKKAQRLWVQLRDAEIDARFPGPDFYGSIAPSCQARILETMTRDRTKHLKVWVDGLPEYEMCNGSVKMKK